jgi:hypothetical protein
MSEELNLAKLRLMSEELNLAEMLLPHKNIDEMEKLVSKLETRLSSVEHTRCHLTAQQALLEPLLHVASHQRRLTLPPRAVKTELAATLAALSENADGLSRTKRLLDWHLGLAKRLHGGRLSPLHFYIQ